MRRILLGIFALLLLVPSAFAHVAYVATDAELAGKGGADLSYLLAPFTNPFELFLVLLVAFGVPLLLWAVWNAGFVVHIRTHFQERTDAYTDLLGWMMRLSVGIALLGAGTAGVLLSPSFPGNPALSALQILLGFLLLAGFLITPVIAIVILLYFLALISHPMAIGSLDLLALSFAILMQGSTLPGVDDLFGIRLFHPPAFVKSCVPLFLRVGIGCAMLFLAFEEKLLNPHFAAVVIEKYRLTNFVPVSVNLWVLGAGLIELLVALFLIFGAFTRLTAAIAFGVVSLSFFFFGESVYAHITLFGTLSVLLVTGSGPYSVDAWLRRRKNSLSK